ncbi:MAG TPA: hypothetical protein VKC34_05535, partial [Blastocatellia bacterium]|nr:hypothetical protein [Blastocatellia bacterium]
MSRLDHQFNVDFGRRRFLSRLAGLPLALGSGPYLARSVSAQELPAFSPDSPYSRAFNFASLAGWLTPNSQFFLRSHFGVPRFNGEPWGVTVSGAVERERVFTIE